MTRFFNENSYLRKCYTFVPATAWGFLTMGVRQMICCKQKNKNLLSMTLKEIIFFFTDTIFRKKPDEYKNPVVRWAARQYKLIFYTMQGLSQHGTMVQSAAMTFYTLVKVI